MLRLEPRPQETPRPSAENVAYTLGTMSRAVARLCATPNECRVLLFELVDEMETREQQLLHATALLRNTLKTLHGFMVTSLTGETAHRHPAQLQSQSQLRNHPTGQLPWGLPP